MLQGLLIFIDFEPVVPNWQVRRSYVKSEMAADDFDAYPGTGRGG